MKKIDWKRMLCTSVAAATILSFGGLVLADEIEVDAEDVSVDEQIETETIEAEEISEAEETEETAETETETPVDEETDAAETEDIEEIVEEEEELFDVIDEEETEIAEAQASDEIIGIVEEEDIVFEAAEAIRNGWHKSGGKWYYYENNVMKTGWIHDGGKWYYCDPTEGYMLTGLQTIKGKLYLLGIDGAMVTGWQTINYETYYFDESGAAVRGWLKYKNKWYYLDDEYHMLRNSMISMPYKGLLYNYYLGNNGAMRTGWVQPWGFSEWYYFDANGRSVRGFQKLGGKWYYFTEDGIMLTGLQIIKENGVDHYYYFGRNGSMVTGWHTAFGHSEVFGDSTYWYYFNKSGRAVSGWQKINGDWYYFNPETHEMYSGYVYVEESGSFFFFDDTGIMQTGWQRPFLAEGNEDWYYFNDSGRPHTGWVNDFGEWSYYDQGCMAHGLWYVKNDELFYFNSEGIMQTGWVKCEDGYYRYFGSDGRAILSGWKKLGKNWYYFDESGRMAIGYCLINGKVYQFDSNGVCLNP